MRKSWRGRRVIFSDSDVAAFDATLRKVYPGLRIVPYSYWDPQSRTTPPESEISYREALSGAETYTDSMQQAWVEPAGWRPQWGPPDKSGCRRIVNLPNLAFTWYRPSLEGGSWSGEPGKHRLLDGEIAARVDDGAKEQSAFAAKVLRLVASLSTNKIPCCYHNSEIGEVSRPFVFRELWIGYGALTWVREDPKRCFFYCHRPADSIS